MGHNTHQSGKAGKSSLEANTTVETLNSRIAQLTKNADPHMREQLQKLSDQLRLHSATKGAQASAVSKPVSLHDISSRLHQLEDAANHKSSLRPNK